MQQGKPVETFAEPQPVFAKNIAKIVQGESKTKRKGNGFLFSLCKASFFHLRLSEISKSFAVYCDGFQIKKGFAHVRAFSAFKPIRFSRVHTFFTNPTQNGLKV